MGRKAPAESRLAGESACPTQLRTFSSFVLCRQDAAGPSGILPGSRASSRQAPADAGVEQMLTLPARFRGDASGVVEEGPRPRAIVRPGALPLLAPAVAPPAFDAGLAPCVVGDVPPSRRTPRFPVRPQTPTVRSTRCGAPVRSWKSQYESRRWALAWR